MVKFFRHCLNIAILLSAFIVDHAASDIKSHIPIGKQRAEELRQWGNRFRESYGPLLNPPVGNVKPKIRQMENEIKSLVEALAGERLRGEGRQLIITIYPDPTPNAFMSKVQWPLGRRREYGPPDIERSIIFNLYKLDRKRPVYELGVTLGLYNLLQTQSERAFVIAHELQHMFEDHVEEQRTFRGEVKRWWGLQRFESIADHLAVKLLVGKYDVMGALGAMEKLSRLHKNDERSGLSVENLLQTHHHEGVRISMLQAFIEYLRRTDPQVQPREWNLVSQVFKLVQNGRQKKNHEGEFDYFLPSLNKMMKQMILPHRPFNYSEAGEEYYKLKIESEDEQVLNVSAENVRAWFNYALDMIEKSNLKPQVKGDAILSLIRWMNDRFLLEVRDQPKIVYDQQLKVRLKKMLLEVAGAGWSSHSYFEWNKSYQKYNGDYDVIKGFVGNHDIQEVFAHLSHVNREWLTFVSQFVAHAAVDSNGKLILESSALGLVLTDRDNTGNRPASPFASEEDKLRAQVKPLHNILFKQAIQFMLSPIFYESFIEELRNRNQKAYEMLWALNAIWTREQERKSNPSANSEFRFSIKPVEDFFLSERQRVVHDLAMGRVNTTNVKILFTTGDLVDFYPWELRNESLFGKALANAAEHMLKNDFFEQVYALSGSLERALYEGISFSALNHKEKLNILKMLAAIRPFHYSYSGIAEKRHIVEAVSMALKGLQPRELMEYFLYEPPAINSSLEKGFSDPNFIATSAKYKVLSSELAALKKQKKAETVEYKAKKMELESLSDRLRKTSGELARRAENKLSSKLAFLSFLGMSREDSRRISEGISVDELQKIIETVRASRREFEQNIIRSHPMYQNLESMNEYLPVSADAGLFLLDIFNYQQGALPTFKQWVDLFSSIVDLNSTSLEMRPEFKSSFEKRFLELSKNERLEVVYEAIKNENVLKTLSLEQVIRIATEHVKFSVEGKGLTDAKVAEVIQKVEADLQMKEKFPDLFEAFRTELAEKIRVQPHQVFTLFPEDKNSINTKSTENFSLEVRGLSAFVGAARPYPVQEQIHLIEYLMGRSSTWPAFVDREAQFGDRYFPFADMLRNAQMKLSRESWLKRAFIVNSFLAGPSSIVEKLEARKILLDHTLKNVSPENKNLATELAEALLTSQGPMKSMALAYILAQKPSQQGASLSEGEIIRSLFEAFGAAGVKLGQYLAFTAEMKGYSEHLAKLQDSALPISYLEAVKLIHSRLGEAWVHSFAVKGLLGTGSVNVAVEYTDNSSGVMKTKVVSLLRSDIEISAKEDFRKLQAFVAELVKNDSKRNLQRFSHLPGLLKIIEKSVTLEFNKENAFLMQKQAFELYPKLKNGWQLQSIDADWFQSGALSMEKAPGRTARKARQENPEAYKQAMRVLLGAELSLLFGASELGKSKAIHFFANPDLHDGQVLIDVENKIVAILDFGQAVPITEIEREMGVSILRLVSGKENLAAMRELVVALGKQIDPAWSSQQVSDEELNRIINRADLMDRFVYLLGTLNQSGLSIPLSSIHWVLGVNRAIQLGRNIGFPAEQEIFGLILANKLGFRQKTFNKLRSMGERLLDAKFSLESLLNKVPEKIKRMSCSNILTSLK
ncbi:MAG: M48 family metalloprotease [Bdellovibrionales bacterium]